MRTETLAIQVPTSVSRGPARKVSDFWDKDIQIDGTFVATVSIEWRINGGSWEVLQVATGKTGIPFPQSADEVCANTTAYTSGTPTATLSGRVGS